MKNKSHLEPKIIDKESLFWFIDLCLADSHWEELDISRASHKKVREVKDCLHYLFDVLDTLEFETTAVKKRLNLILEKADRILMTNWFIPIYVTIQWISIIIDRETWSNNLRTYHWTINWVEVKLNLSMWRILNAIIESDWNGYQLKSTEYPMKQRIIQIFPSWCLIWVKWQWLVLISIEDAKKNRLEKERLQKKRAKSLEIDADMKIDTMYWGLKILSLQRKRNIYEVSIDWKILKLELRTYIVLKKLLENIWDIIKLTEIERKKLSKIRDIIWKDNILNKKWIWYYLRDQNVTLEWLQPTKTPKLHYSSKKETDKISKDKVSDQIPKDEDKNSIEYNLDGYNLKVSKEKTNVFKLEFLWTEFTIELNNSESSLFLKILNWFSFWFSKNEIIILDYIILKLERASIFTIESMQWNYKIILKKHKKNKEIKPSSPEKVRADTTMKSLKRQVPKDPNLAKEMVENPKKPWFQIRRWKYGL